MYIFDNVLQLFKQVSYKDTAYMLCLKQAVEYFFKVFLLLM